MRNEHRKDVGQMETRNCKEISRQSCHDTIAQTFRMLRLKIIFILVSLLNLCFALTELTDWQLQSSAEVSASGQQISISTYDASDW